MNLKRNPSNPFREKSKTDIDSEEDIEIYDEINTGCKTEVKKKESCFSPSPILVFLFR